MTKLSLMFVTHEPPVIGHGGSGNYLNMMLKYFKQSGHDVSLFLVDWGFIDKKIIEQSINDLKNSGIKIKFINFQKENILNKFIKFFFLIFSPSKIFFKQSKYLQKNLKSYQEEINPDIFFLYCAQSLEWSKKINIKKFCPLIELPFLNSKLWLNFALRKKFQYVSSKKRFFAFINLYINFFSQKKIIELYKNCDFKAHVSYDYYSYLKKIGIKNIKYYDHPVEDMSSSLIKKINDKISNQIPTSEKLNKKFSIILVGKLSTITYLQYEFLQNEILPEIIKNDFVKNNIEIRLIGAKKHSDFNNLYKCNFVNHVGYVENFEEELINSDLYLCPSPKPLGSRSRLNEGMAYGCCILTSVYDQNADPNLIDGYNCFISRNPKEYVEKIEKLIKDPELKNLIKKNSLKTYNTKFKKSIACREYEKDILELKNNG